MEEKKHPLVRGIYYGAQFTWGIIQNFFGLMVCLYLRLRDPSSKMPRYHGAIVTKWKAHSSMGLGMFMFFGHEGAPDAENVKSHEFGHTVQSAVLGPLFLFVIGIPSFIWANLKPFVNLRKKRNIKYVSLYCEKWANAWGKKVTGIDGPQR